MPFLAEAAEGFHCPFLKVVSQRGRSPRRQLPVHYTGERGYGFVISPARRLPISLPAFASGHCARCAAPTKGETVI